MTSPFPSRRPVETPPARSGYNCRRARISKVLLMAPCSSHFHRRGFLAAAGAAGLSWLTPLGTALARAAEKERTPAKSVIVLWLGGGPSQLETFDPKPGTNIAAAPAPSTPPQGRATGHRVSSSSPIRWHRSRWCARCEQGGRPRTRHVHHEDRLPARSDGRAPLARRRSAATSCPVAGVGNPAARLDPPEPMAGPRRLPRRRVRRLQDRTTPPTRCPM